MSSARKSDLLKIGDTYRVRGSGPHGGTLATVITKEPFPDTDLERRRKITVEIDGDLVYILPRLLEVDGFQTPSQKAAHSNVTPLPTLGQDHTAAMPERIKIPSPITDVDDPRLDPYRPDPAVVKEYISRKVPNGKTDIEFLLDKWSERTNVMLVGDTQAGKTMLVRVLAVAAGKAMGLGKPLPVFTLSGSSGVTDFDLFGQPTSYVDTDGIERLVWLPGVVDLAVRAGGILYLDEANMMGERVTSSLHSVCDDRKSFTNRAKAVVAYDEDGGETFIPEVVNANENLWVVGTVNPGYRGAGAMNEAFTNRFQWIPWGYDDKTEKKLIPSDAVRLLGQALRDAYDARQIATPVGTATLAQLHKNVEHDGVETALWMFKSMFEKRDLSKVEAIITDRSIVMLINDEQKAKAQAAQPAAQEVDAFGEPVEAEEPF